MRSRTPSRARHRSAADPAHFQVQGGLGTVASVWRPMAGSASPKRTLRQSDRTVGRAFHLNLAGVVTGRWDPTRRLISGRLSIALIVQAHEWLSAGGTPPIVANFASDSRTTSS